MIALLQLLAVSVGLLIGAAPLAAEELTTGASPASAPHGSMKSSEDAKPTTAPAKRLPVDSTTTQALNLVGRRLDFRATAGSIQLSDDKGTPEADVGYIAYQVNGPDAHKRPVTFVFNGGPGAGSAWLQLGAVGPWRLPMNGLSASSTPTLVDNEETWLDFTDLVFIDPPGSGNSRIVAPGDEVPPSLRYDSLRCGKSPLSGVRDDQRLNEAWGSAFVTAVALGERFDDALALAPIRL